MSAVGMFQNLIESNESPVDRMRALGIDPAGIMESAGLSSYDEANALFEGKKPKKEEEEPEDKKDEMKDEMKGDKDEKSEMDHGDHGKDEKKESKKRRKVAESLAPISTDATQIEEAAALVSDIARLMAERYESAGEGEVCEALEGIADMSLGLTEDTDYPRLAKGMQIVLKSIEEWNDLVEAKKAKKYEGDDSDDSDDSEGDEDDKKAEGKMYASKHKAEGKHKKGESDDDEDDKKAEGKKHMKESLDLRKSHGIDDLRSFVMG